MGDSPVSGEKLGVYVVDDSPIWVDALVSTLSASGKVEVLGHAASVKEACAAGPRTEPDVYLVDMRLPDGSGLDFLNFLNESFPVPPPVVFLTVEDDYDVAAEALRLGGRGYLGKDVRGSSLSEMLTVVHNGGYAVPGDVAARALSAQRALPRRHVLTARERQILLLLCSGVTSDEGVAGKLHISPRTAKTHLASIRRKLAVSDRAAVVAYAFRTGMVSVGAGGEVLEA